MGYRNDLRDEVAPHTTSSTASYFIPLPEPGLALVSAQFRSFLVVNGDPSQVTINGRSPRIDTPFHCFVQEPVDACSGDATWDLTADAVAQIGGELPVTFDPNPPGFDGTSGFAHVRIDGYGLNMSVNYPWAILDTSGVLELTFQETYPKQLNLTVTPSSVRPVIGGAGQNATVQAFVHTCPPDGGGAPASVDVTLEVQPPHPGDPGGADGGHLHGERPSTAFGKLNGQNQQPVVCEAVIDATGTGSCTGTYQPSEVSGVETITATAPDFPTATAEIRVEAPGLMSLVDVRTNFVRLTGQTPEHPDNHWGTADTLLNIQGVALDFFRKFEGTLGINDMSLRMGGLFDLRGTWQPPHSLHRTGRSVDIDHNACSDPDLVGACGRLGVSLDWLETTCTAHMGTRIHESPDPKTGLVPLHCEF